MRTYTTTHAAYLDTLAEVLYNPSFKSAPRGQPILEKLDYQFTVLHPTSEPLVTKDEERNKTIAEYTAKEVKLYDSGSNSVRDFAKASKFWNQIANPDGTINSAYGYLIWHNRSYGQPFFESAVKTGAWNDTMTQEEHDSMLRTPWEHAKQSLICDKDSRQAMIKFALPEHFYKGNKDVTCTTHGIFMIRDNELHLSIVMRSNDLMKGLAFDMPWFISLMDKMVDELKPTYPDLAKGCYTHTVHSLHIYEKDIPVIKKMIGE
jgi:thymidylate synthase